MPSIVWAGMGVSINHSHRKTTKAVASICEYLSSNPLGLFGTILE